MKISEFKTKLAQMNELHFILPNGEAIPSHFHVTEIGAIEKHFIDCGGTIRKESKVNFQLWTAEDVDHRLQALKLRDIISLSEEKLGLKDAEIEVEYQGDTIGKYDLRFSQGAFHLHNTQTDCLAKDNCGVPASKPRIRLSELNKPATCSPSSNCC